MIDFSNKPCISYLRCLPRLPETLFKSLSAQSLWDWDGFLPKKLSGSRRKKPGPAGLYSVR